jgi:hypothetical protein
MASPDIPTTAILGYGTKVAIQNDASPAAYVEIEEVRAVTPPNQQTEQVEATHMQSANRTREFITGLVDPGEMTFEINWRPGNTSDQRLTALKNSGVYKLTRVTWPNTVTWTFLGAVTGLEPSTPIDDVATMTVTMRVSGTTTIVIPSPLP